MADSPILPGSHAWRDASGRPLPVEFYRFLRDLVAFIREASSNTESIAELAEQLAELLSRTYSLTGIDSVQVLGLLKDGATVRLVGDEDNPLPAHFYATDDDRAKGWNPLYPHWVPNPYADYLVDENGDYLIDENGDFLTGQDGFPIPLQYGGTGGDYALVTANKFFASPVSSSGSPTFRALESEDIASSFKLVYVMTKADLPASVGGVITLADNTPYWFMNNIDLTGDRIQCGANSVIFGNSSSSTALTSTSLSGALITSASALRLHDISLSAPTGSVFDLDNGATGNLIVKNVVVSGSPTLGSIQNYSTILISDSSFVGCANLTLDGTIASFIAEFTHWDGLASQTTISVAATCAISMRFIAVYSSFVVGAGETGINFSSSASIPDESYILDSVNFSGGGTYISGVTQTSNKSAFSSCVGITNSSSIAQYYMAANATATTISVAGTFVKAAGTTTAVSSLQQKFTTATSNRAQYVGATASAFRVSAVASMTSSNNQLLRMRFAVNGTTLVESTVEFTTSGAGDASNIANQTLLTLNPNDYVEVFVTNDTATNNITVRDLNVIITRLN